MCVCVCVCVCVRARARERARVMYDLIYVCPCLSAAMDDDNLAGTLPYKIDCDNPYVCLDDIEPHCTSTGQVFGHCGLQIAICL